MLHQVAVHPWTHKGSKAKKTPAPQPVLVAPVTQTATPGATNTIIPAPPVPVTETIEEEEPPAWIVERTIIPFIAKCASFISRSLVYYVNHAIVLLLLLVLARAFELIYDWALHGTPKLFGKVIVAGLAKDFVFFLQIGAWGYLLFALIYFIHKKAAHLFFIVAAVLLLLIQVSLSQYFISTLVPLGADIWGYSIADIKQTVGASGGIKLPVMIVLGGFLVLVIYSLIFLPKRIKLSGWVAFFFLVLFSLASFTKGPSLVNEWMPGEEYSNNLSINKSWYFFDASYRHFFPLKEEQDIYSNHYSGDYFTSADDANLSQIKYVDEKNYPFLQNQDWVYS